MANKKKVDTSQMPYVENYPPLSEWLKKHDARCMWQLSMDQKGENEPPTAYVELYVFPKNSMLAIVRVYANKMGWDIYTPSRGNNIKSTLEDAERRLGLTS